MKFKTLIFAGYFAVMLAGCGFFQDEASKEPTADSSTSSLALNKECASLHADSSLIKALEAGDLAQLKGALEGCASLDPKAYSLPDSVTSVFAIPGLFDQKDADSLLIYLVENGGDSAAKAFRKWETEGIMTTATYNGRYVFVHHLLAKGYPADPRAAYYAVMSRSRGLYDSLVDRIDDLDSIVGNLGPVLKAICISDISSSSEESPYEWYFKDLLSRGASPDPKSLGEPATCASDPTAQRRLEKPILSTCLNARDSRYAKMLIESGVGPDIRYCFRSSERVESTLENVRTFSPALAAYMDSVAVARGQKVP